MTPNDNCIRSTRRPHADYAVDLRQRRIWRDGEGAEATITDTSAGVSTEGTTTAGGSAALTQEQANKLIGDARKKGREAAVADLLKELGLDKADDLKSLVRSAKERADAEKSEADKATEARTKAEQRVTELEQTLNAERLAARLERRDNVLRDALRSAGVVDGKDAPNVARVLTLLRAEQAADVDGVQAEDGTLDSKKVDALVETARKSYPEYFKGARLPQGTGSHRDGRVADSGRDGKAFGERNISGF